MASVKNTETHAAAHDPCPFVHRQLTESEALVQGMIGILCALKTV